MRLSVKRAGRMKLSKLRPSQIAGLEVWLAVITLLLILVACAGPFVAQPDGHHAFADQRTFLGIPFALDVLSNLPFAIWGLAGLWLAWPVAAGRHEAASDNRAQGWQALIFCTGLVMTSACSSWYHLNPSDASLAVDRCGMVLAFAGLLGLAAGSRAGKRAGWCMTTLVVVLGPVAVAVWSMTGNVTLWLVLQFGGLLLIVWLACLAPVRGALPVRWFLVIFFYALAKCLEMADHQVYEVAGHLVSGHSLKHLVASFSAWPVISALLQRRVSTGRHVTMK